MRYRTIIVEDEVKALERMEKLCRRSPDIEVTGTFTKPADALEFAKSNSIDLALLDIEMPKMSGLELAELIQEHQPQADIVFITAYDKYALEAFQVNAVGYLLKPIELSGLEQQIAKLNKKKQIRSVPYNKRRMRIQCMGGFYAYKDRDMQERIKWRTAKAEELLAFLIHHRGQAVTKDKIVDILWPEMDYDKASKNLHAISYYIREAFQEIGYEDVFIRSKGQYQLKMERMEVDAADLEALIAYAPLKAIPDERIASIMKLAKGRYFEGKDYAWAIAADAWLQNKLDEISLIQAEREQNDGNRDAAVDALLDAIKRNPCNDHAYKMLIRIYASEGNQIAAKQWYKAYETNLRNELDAEPDPDIKKLLN